MLIQFGSWIDTDETIKTRRLKEMCRKNKEVHSKQITFHTDGSKFISRKRHEIEQVELVITQDEKDGSGPSTNDAISKVFGEEHFGRANDGENYPITPTIRRTSSGEK
ncbi:hypothetical protein HN51_024863 [Arachis hypogaea]